MVDTVTVVQDSNPTLLFTIPGTMAGYYGSGGMGGGYVGTFEAPFNMEGYMAVMTVKRRIDDPDSYAQIDMIENAVMVPGSGFPLARSLGQVGFELFPKDTMIAADDYFGQLAIRLGGGDPSSPPKLVMPFTFRVEKKTKVEYP